MVEYFGFTLTEDPHYLLGDFTVTHNSGKTTVLREFENQGHRVVHESAAALIQAGGFHPAIDFQEFQFAVKWAIEKAQARLDPRELVFLDRSYLDAQAFAIEASGEPMSDDYFKGITHERYFEVFLFEPLDWVNDGIRDHDSPEGAQRIFESLKTIYPVHTIVPKSSVAQRVALIRQVLFDRLMKPLRELGYEKPQQVLKYSDVSIKSPESRL